MILYDLSKNEAIIAGAIAHAKQILAEAGETHYVHDDGTEEPITDALLRKIVIEKLSTIKLTGG